MRQGSPHAKPPRATGWAVPVAVVVASLVLSLFAWRFSRQFAVFGEETTVLPGAPAVVLEREPAPDGLARLVEICPADATPGLSWSNERPQWVLCTPGRVWPILIVSYIAGIFYWPTALFGALGHGDALTLRALGVPIGVVVVLVSALFARRLAGRRAAVFTALAAGTVPVVVALHATLIWFEILPWLLLMLGALAWLGVREAPASISRRRAIVAAALAGLGLLADAKAGALLLPLAAALVRSGAVKLADVRRHLRPMVAVGVLTLMPIAAGLLLRPATIDDGKAGEALVALAAHLAHPSQLFAAASDTLLWWSNLAYYLAPAMRPMPFGVAAFGVAVASAAFVSFAGVRTLVRGGGSPLAAVAGVTLLGFTAMVSLLYARFPINFSPLYGVFAIATGAALASLSRALERTAAGRAAALAPALLLLPFAHESHKLTYAAEHATSPFHIEVERSVADWLVSHPDPRAVNVIAEEQLSGVFDSMTGGRARTVQGVRLLGRCADDRAAASDPAWIDRAVRALLARYAGHPLRFVAVSWCAYSPCGHGDTQAIVAAFVRAGRVVREEASYATPDGAPGMAIYSVGEAAPGSAPP